MVDSPTRAAPPSPHEARALLLGLARAAFGPIAPERIAEHVATVTEGCDWPVQRAAVLALARRYRFAQRDELKVSERPAERATGLYRTESAAQRDKRSTRPYDTVLWTLSPLRMSCSCADFVRSSLGLCKHGLTVLADLEEAARVSTAPEPLPALSWDPIQKPSDCRSRLTRIASSDGVLEFEAALDTPSARLAWIERVEQRLARDERRDPALGTVLREERERAERQLACGAAASRCEGALTGLRRRLYGYQEEGVRRFLARGRLLLADDMGLGKTTQAIAAAHALVAAGAVTRALIITPSALKPQWLREWQATTDLPLCVVEGAAAQRAECYRAGHGLLLLSYEQLVRDIARVQRFAPELVILDEAQRIKNWASKSAAYVKVLASRYRLVLTGTPLENRLDELASIMDFVDDVALEPKWRLAPYHALHETDDGRAVAGARHLDTLRTRLSESLLRRVRRDVLTQLPERTDTRIPVELTEAQRAVHDAKRPAIAEIVAQARRRPLAREQFMRLMQLLTQQRMICNGLGQLEFDTRFPALAGHAPTQTLLDELHAPKLAALRALLEQVLLVQGRKVVVFSQWRNALTLAHWAISDLLESRAMRALFFTGAQRAEQREQALLEFHDDPAATIMFLTDVGGVGLNLQRAASVCVNLELPWNPAVLEQRIGRIYRLGQEQPVDIYNLVCEEGIEARIAQLVADKRALFTSLFEGESDEVVFERQGSFLDDVRKLLDLEGGGGETTGKAVPARTRQKRTQASEPRVRVTRLASGALRIDAPAELAANRDELLAAIARTLESDAIAAAAGPVAPATSAE